MHHGLVTRGKHGKPLPVIGETLEVPIRIRRTHTHSPIHRSQRISRILGALIARRHHNDHTTRNSTSDRHALRISPITSSSGNRQDPHTISNSSINHIFIVDTLAFCTIIIIRRGRGVVDDFSPSRHAVTPRGQNRHHSSGMRTGLIRRRVGAHLLHGDAGALQLGHTCVGRPVDHADLNALAREASRHLVLNSQGTHVPLRRDLINRMSTRRTPHAQTHNHAQRHHNAGKARADTNNADAGPTLMSHSHSPHSSRSTSKTTPSSSEPGPWAGSHTGPVSSG